MTEMMPASAPEEIRSSEEKTGWEDVAETHFAGDENFEEWQAEKLAREEEEQKRNEIIELKKKAGRDIAVEVIRNPGKYEEMQSEGEAKIAEIREKVREEWMAKGASAEVVREFGEKMGEQLWTLAEAYNNRVKTFNDYVATGMEGDISVVEEAYNEADKKYYAETNAYFELYDSYMPVKFMDTNAVYGTDFGESGAEIRLVELVYAIEKEILGE